MVYDENLKDYVCCADIPVWVVKEVKANPDYTLLLTFANGEKRIYNARPLLEEAVYRPLKNLAFFLRARVDGDSVAWSDDVDIAPEHLYENSTLIEGTGSA